MTTLAEIDDVLAEHEDAISDVCASYFDEAMASVRDAIDGSWSNYTECEADDCTAEEFGDELHSCSDTLARWRPPETRSEEVTPLGLDAWRDRWAMPAPLFDFAESYAQGLRDVAAFGRAYLNVWVVPQELQVVSFIWGRQPSSFWFDEPVSPPQDGRLRITFEGRRVLVDTSIAPEHYPPVREHWTIQRWDRLFSVQAPVMPKRPTPKPIMPVGFPGQRKTTWRAQ